MSRFLIASSIILLSTAVSRAGDEPGVSGAPLRYTVSWIGNSFPGGNDQWVQNSVVEAAITADGCVYTSSEWDEGGRCVAAYKDGRTNSTLFKENNGGAHNCWGWGTASRAVAADEKFLYVINLDGNLLRFRRADQYFEESIKVGPAVDMTYRNGVLTIVRSDGWVERRKAPGGHLVNKFRMTRAGDVAEDDRGRLWLRVGKEIRSCNAQGKTLSGTIRGLEDPADVAIDQKGRVIVCENGSRSQVLFYEVDGRGEPKLVETFGKRGGLLSGVPGVVKDEPTKLFSIRSAGTDALGNLYVVLGRNAAIIRKFDPNGSLAWEAQSLFFVDATSILPGSDGKVIYSREEIIEYDYDEPPGRRAWKLRAITADFDRHPEDRRKDPAGMGRVRLIDGHRLLFACGMMGGPMPIFYFDAPSAGELAIDSGLSKGDGWASWPDERGNVWQIADRKIVVDPLIGFDPIGKPIYGDPRTYPVTGPFVTVERVVYEPESDVMILSGFTHDAPDPGGAWGLVGTELVRYDHWSRMPKIRWRTRIPFKTWEKGGPHEMIMPKCLDVAGDFVFVCYVFQGVGKGNNPPVRIYRRDDGAFVGQLRPGGVVGDGKHGWVDMVQGMSAFKRSAGEYVILVEEDSRGKNVLYRWTPEPAVGR
ncbi:MAG: hypothetical protein ACP5XB_22780 [Isosphaeraceae bacterium]